MTDRGHGKNNVFAKDGVVLNGKFLSYEVDPTFSDSKQIVTKGYVDSSPISHLEQLQKYYVAKAGNDSNTGKSEDDPFLTIGAANTAIAARIPSSTNIFGVELLDGIYTEDFTMQPYTIYYGPCVELIGEVVGVDHSSIFLKRWSGKSSGGGVLFTKTTGGATTRITVLENIVLNTSAGILITLGALNVQADRIEYGTADVIAPGCSGSTISIHCDNAIVALGGTAKLVNLSASTMRIDIFSTNIEDNGTTGSMVDITGTGGGTKLNIYGDRLETLQRKAFNIGNLATVTTSMLYYKEAATSTVTGSGVFNKFSITDINNSNKTTFENPAGIDIKTGSLELPSGTSVNDISTDTTFTTATDDQLATKAAIKTYVAQSPIGHQQKNKVFFVDSSGNDSNTGKSEDDTLLTISAAVAKINAERPTPDIDDLYRIMWLGGGAVIEDVSLPKGVGLEMPGTVYAGNLTGNDYSYMRCYAISAPSSGAKINVQVAGSGFNVGFSVFAESHIVCGVNGGFKNTSNKDITVFFTHMFDIGGGVIPVTNTGDINLIGHYIRADGGGSVFFIDGTYEVYIKCNYIDDVSSGSPIIFRLNAACFVHVEANRIRSIVGKIYDTGVGGAPVLDITANDMKEGAASANPAATVNIRATRNPGDYAEIRNQVNGVKIIAPGFSAPSVVTTTFGQFTITSDITTFSFNNSILKSEIVPPLLNLTTTPVTVGTLQTASEYSINIFAPDGSNGIFKLFIGQDFGVIHYLALGTYAGGIFSLSPANQVNINLTGYTPGFVLVINLFTLVATLATTSGTATGTTTLRMVRITP